MTRMSAKQRKEQFIKTGLDLAARGHYLTVRGQNVTDKVGVSTGLLQNYFATLLHFRKAIVRKAIKDGQLQVIAQAMGARDPLVKRCPEHLKRAALEGIKESYGL